MRKRIDLTGQRLGKWLVKSRAENDKQGRARWNCLCNCGRETSVDMCNLRTGASVQCISCGNSHPDGVAAFNRVYKDYKYGAKRRGLSWELNEEQFRKITSSPCHYTGLLPCTTMKTAGGEYIYNGIDRLDNTKGYTLENCVPCNGRINEMKMDSSLEDFIEHCRLVVNHFTNKASA